MNIMRKNNFTIILLYNYLLVKINKFAGWLPYEVYSDKKKQILAIIIAPFMILAHIGTVFKIIRKKYLSLLYVEIVVTTHCSLKCKFCSNFIQYYKKPYHVDIETNLKSIGRLLEAVDNICLVRLLGGETLLYPELEQLLSSLIGCEKVAHIQVVTNGTIIPKSNVISKLKHPNVSVSVSNYGKNSYKIRELSEVLKKENIRHYISPEDLFWLDYGGPNKIKKNEKQLQQQFGKCVPLNCNSILNGQLHFCPVSAHGMDLGYVERRKNDYIDLLDATCSTTDLRQKLWDFQYGNKPYITACQYCNKCTDLATKIRPGEQL